MTVAIPVRNEEANLARCLERLTRFAEGVVIDSGSTDATRRIAHRLIRRVRIIDAQRRSPEWSHRQEAQFLLD